MVGDQSRWRCSGLPHGLRPVLNWEASGRGLSEFDTESPRLHPGAMIKYDAASERIYRPV